MVPATSADQAARKTNVAHRGASAYAPEHTLERTTNVEDLFPDRSSTVTWEGKTVKAWLANDFTLEEIRRLDAGSWFSPTFAGARVPTFDEAVRAIKGKAGLFPELKTPEVYQGRDVDFERLVAAALDKHGLRGPNRDPKTPVILQTFSEASAKTLLSMPIGVPVVLLIGNSDGWDSPVRIKTWKAAGLHGFGPAKQVLLKHPNFVNWAHEDGLTVTPYTFRSSDTRGFAGVREEMAHYLYALGVDAVFTDNPDQFPRR